MLLSVAASVKRISSILALYTLEAETLSNYYKTALNSSFIYTLTEHCVILSYTLDHDADVASL